MLAQLEQQIAALYTQLQQGKDVSPAQRFRLEGKLLFCLENQLCHWQELQLLVDTLYQRYFDETVDATFWQWCIEQHCFRLPMQMVVAPVR